MSYSSLVSYVKISPFKQSPRNHVIDTITIHCMAGNCSIETCGEVFQRREASSNYGIGTDGRIATYVDEDDRSYCSSSRSNDNRAVTIEVANDGDANTDWHVSNLALTSLITLCSDICKRHGIKKLLWKADKSLIGQIDQQNMTVHRWFANKACPGDYLYNNHGYIANEVNKILLKSEDDDMIRYTKLEDIPNEFGFRDVVEKLMDSQIIKGDGSDPNGNDDVIDLSHDQVRSLVFEYRGGAFDRKLIAMGLNPAVLQ